MNFKRIAVIICTVIMAFTFSSCNSLDMNIDNLLSPPKQDGDIYPIQQALEAAVGNNITLKYPIAGDYRSAFSFMDIDADGVDEALALYSLNTNGTVSMHLNVIDYEMGEWVSRSDVKVVGSGIEKITFCDLNADSIPEIIVGWMIYGTVDKQVGVYTYDGKALNQRVLEKYTNFLCDSLNDDNKDELIVIDLNTTDKTSEVKMLALSEAGITEIGSAFLDGGVTSYSAPIVSKLADGRKALYIDAIKGTGTLTEIVWFKDNILRSTYDTALAETRLTYRPSAVYTKDINADGTLEIPIMSLLASTALMSETDKVYVTSWCNFDGAALNVIENTFMNYTDGYYLTVSDKWMNSIHLARKVDSRQRIFYSYDPATDMQGNEVFRIVATTQSDIDSGKFDNTGYEQLRNVNGMIYLTKVTENNELGITVETILENFYIIQ